MIESILKLDTKNTVSGTIYETREIERMFYAMEHWLPFVTLGSNQHGVGTPLGQVVGAADALFIKDDQLWVDYHLYDELSTTKILQELKKSNAELTYHPALTADVVDGYARNIKMLYVHIEANKTHDPSST
jgi:hypothetical protein